MPNLWLMTYETPFGYSRNHYYLSGLLPAPQAQQPSRALRRRLWNRKPPRTLRLKAEFSEQMTHPGRTGSVE